MFMFGKLIKSLIPSRDYLNEIIVCICNLNGVTNTRAVFIIRVFIISLLSITPGGFIVFVMMIKYLEKHEGDYLPPHPHRFITTWYS